MGTLETLGWEVQCHWLAQRRGAVLVSQILGCCCKNYYNKTHLTSKPMIMTTDLLPATYRYLKAIVKSNLTSCKNRPTLMSQLFQPHINRF